MLVNNRGNNRFRQNNICELRRVFRLKVELKHVYPIVWRRVLVTGDFTLKRLHRVIQESMGWGDRHPHHFMVGETLYGESMGHPLVEDETFVRLSRISRMGVSRFLYTYDFNDQWEHEIVIERQTPMERNIRYPLCVKGERACPPEDVGGPWGYVEFLSALNDVGHPQNAHVRKWAGANYDPENLDLAIINRRLTQVG